MPGSPYIGARVSGCTYHVYYDVEYEIIIFLECIRSFVPFLKGQLRIGPSSFWDGQHLNEMIEWLPEVPLFSYATAYLFFFFKVVKKRFTYTREACGLSAI